MHRQNQIILQLSITLLAWTISPLAIAAERGQPRVGRAGNIAEPIEMFTAMDAGLVSVKFIALDAAEANVLFQNNSDRVVRLQLPDAFAAVPVLAQFGQDAFGAGQGQAGGGGANQGVGGGMNQGIGQGFGNGMQGGNGRPGGAAQRPGLVGGFMRIAPHKTRKMKVTTVCLEHGKPEPKPRVAYRMIPIEQFTRNARVAALCKTLGKGGVAQNTAQAAAWHLANEMSWEELSEINRIESNYLGDVKFFEAVEIAAAKKLVEAVTAEQQLLTSISSDETRP